MKKFILLQCILLTIIPFSFYSVEYQSSLKLGNTAIWWTLQVVILLLFWRANFVFNDTQNRQKLLLITYYLIWNSVSIFRGILVSETYWDFKALVTNSLGLLLPIVAYAATNLVLVQSLLSYYIKYALPLFLVLVFFISTDVYGFYLVPISFMMLFFPALPKFLKLVILSFSTVVLLVDLDARSNVIRFVVPVLLLSIYYVRGLFYFKWIELTRKIIIVTPVIFFILAITGIFNIFKMDDYINGDYSVVKKDMHGQKVENSLKADTRTFLYIEVLQTALEYNSWLAGRSPALGNKSEAFGDTDMNKRGERTANEVAILNIFTWTGLIGVLLFFVVISRASYLAVNHSNNTYSKVVGIYLSFRWVYSWVEDINEFTLNYFFLWLTIGLCFSNAFREMSDLDIKHWIRGILDTRFKMKFYNTKKVIPSRSIID